MCKIKINLSRAGFSFFGNLLFSPRSRHLKNANFSTKTFSNFFQKRRLRAKIFFITSYGVQKASKQAWCHRKTKLVFVGIKQYYFCRCSCRQQCKVVVVFVHVLWEFEVSRHVVTERLCPDTGNDNLDHFDNIFC